MDTFKRIKWQTSLEDVIDDVFIRDERMERDSAMHKILTGTFTNPFQDMSEDYAAVDIEKIKHFSGSIDIVDDNEEEQEENKQERIKGVDEDEKNSTKEGKNSYKRSYIPGLRKQPFNYPRKSWLNKTQHAMCLRVLLRFFSNEKKPMTKEEKMELESYLSWQQLINEEQNEFLEYAKMNWNDTAKLLIKCDRYITRKWEAKVQNLQQLPRYYVEYTNIPFSSDKNVVLKFKSCLQQESFSEIRLPKLNCPFFSNVPVSLLRKKYPISVTFDKMKQHFKLPVSEDTYCENLAETFKTDLVISSSGLKCLLNNIDSTYSNAWIIPIVIKSYNGKNVAYIDKKLPSLTATAPQKNTWVYKYILRYFFIHAEDKSSDVATFVEEDKSKDVTYLRSEDENRSFNDYLKDYENDFYTSDVEDNFTDVEIPSTNKEKNVTYNLFTIGLAESQDQSKLKQNTVPEYQILIRTKTDGIEMLPNGKSQHLMLAPKMEHQLEFGAEAVSLDEGLQQWVSLICRPDTSLARVRIAADTGEVIQIERHTAATLSDEMKRLYDVKVVDSLKILYNIIEKLSSLMPGRYLMRHTGSNGPFSYIYKETEECGKKILDLHAIYESKTFYTVPVTPWSPIDTKMTTPALKLYNRMPATFLPNNQMASKTSNPMKKCDANQPKGPVRRSLRKKNKNKKYE